MPRGLCTPLGHGKRNGGPGFLQGRHSAFPPEKRLLAVMSRKDGFSGAFHATKKRRGESLQRFWQCRRFGVVPHQVETMRDAFIARRDYILMEHLQVVEGGRQQWHIQRDGEGGYIFQAVSRDPAKARATVNDLLRASNLPFHAEGDAATAYLHVPASQVRAFAAAMSEANVITYKEAHR